MKGIIFTEFLSMVEDEFGFEDVDHILSEGLPSGGVYTAVGHYSADELHLLVGRLSARRAVPVSELLTAFGRWVFPRLLAAHADLVVGIDDLETLLERLDQNVHVAVRRLYPKAELPSFAFERQGAKLVMEYRSDRRLGAFARGLLLAAIEHFEADYTLSDRKLDEEGRHVEFVLAPPAGSLSAERT